VVSELAWEEPATKDAVALLDACKLMGRVLLVLPEPTADGVVEKSFRNLSRVRIAYAGGLGVYDLLLADRVLLTVAALDAIEGVGGGEAA
jgi:ribosomal protein L4